MDVVQLVRAILDLGSHHSRPYSPLINLRLLQSGHHLILPLSITTRPVYLTPKACHREHLHLHVLLTNTLYLLLQIRDLLFDVFIAFSLALILHFLDALLQHLFVVSVDIEVVFHILQLLPPRLQDLNVF